MTTLQAPIFDDTPPPTRQITICVKPLVPPLNKSTLITPQTVKDYKRASLASLLAGIRREALDRGYVIRTQPRNLQQHNETGLRIWTIEDPAKYNNP